MNDQTGVFAMQSDPACEVALELFYVVVRAEGRRLVADAEGNPAVSRKYILDTYAECLKASTGRRVTP